MRYTDFLSLSYLICKVRVMLILSSQRIRFARQNPTSGPDTLPSEAEDRAWLLWYHLIKSSGRC